MRGNRSILVGVSALVLAVGMLGANGYFQWLNQSQDKRPPAKQSSQTSNRPFERQFDSLAELADEPMWDMPIPERLPEHTGPARRYFPHDSESLEIAQADGAEIPPARAGKSPLLPPRLFPDPVAPIDPAPPADWLSRLIEQELPHASEQERRIWSQELRGFEPEAVRDILRARRSSGLAGRAPKWPGIMEPSPALVPPPVEPPRPASDDSVADRLEPSLAALEKARDVVLNNLANLHTVGFKRSRVVLAAFPSRPRSEQEPSLGVAVGLGVELAGTPLDLSPGPMKNTHQPLDVGIEGPGFFQIQDQDETLYTRCGQFSLDGEGRLCVWIAAGLQPVQPAVVLPKEAERIEIQETGEVTGVVPGSGELERRVFGRLKLARFRNPAGLWQKSGQVFAASQISGPAVVGDPQSQGFGTLRPGQLEESNVSRDEELETFQTIQSHWRLLKHLADTADVVSMPGPVTRRPAGRTERVSSEPAARDPLKPIKTLQNRGRNLIEKYLQSKRMKTIRRTLGLETEGEEDRDPGCWCRRFFQSNKARAIERSLGSR